MAHSEVSAVSNELGEYAFTGVLDGDYEVTVTLAGFQPVTKRLAIKTNDTAKLDFQLVPKGQTETINVTAEPSGVDLSSSSGGTPGLNAKILKSVVRLN